MYIIICEDSISLFIAKKRFLNPQFENFGLTSVKFIVMRQRHSSSISGCCSYEE